MLEVKGEILRLWYTLIECNINVGKTDPGLL